MRFGARGPLLARRAKRTRNECNAKTPVGNRPLKVISWNLLRLTGAGVKDVAALIARHKPDLLLLQEATEDLCALPDLVGGHFFREPLDGRIYGLAVWSPHPLPEPYALRLPVSQVPGRVPPRVAQIVQFGEVAFANVHLSHGQFLNRWQLLHIATALEGPAAIVGDYNAVGPVKLGGFKDIGPRQPTHSPSTIISFRLDRCMARGLRCRESRVLARGPSDHHPIVLELQPVPSAAYASGRHAALRAKLARQHGALAAHRVGAAQSDPRRAEPARSLGSEAAQQPDAQGPVRPHALAPGDARGER